MLLQTVVLLLLVGLGVAAVSLSIAIARRGKLYRGLEPEARPRRWVLMAVLTLMAVFLLWFPVWMLWPHSLVGRVLTLLFGVTFFIVGMTLKWFSGFVDWYVKRRGWRLR